MKWRYATDSGIFQIPEFQHRHLEGAARPFALATEAHFNNPRIALREQALYADLSVYKAGKHPRQRLKALEPAVYASEPASWISTCG